MSSRKLNENWFLTILILWDTSTYLCFPCSPLRLSWVCYQGVIIKWTIVTLGEAKWDSYVKAPPKSIHMATNYSGYTEVMNSLWSFFDGCGNNWRMITLGNNIFYKCLVFIIIFIRTKISSVFMKYLWYFIDKLSCKYCTMFSVLRRHFYHNITSNDFLFYHTCSLLVVELTADVFVMEKAGHLPHYFQSCSDCWLYSFDLLLYGGLGLP